MKKEIRRNALKICVPFIAIMTTVLSTALPVLADSTLRPVPAIRLVQGEVLSVSSDNSTSDNSTFVIQNRSQQQMTIKVDANTKFYIISMGKAAEATEVISAVRDKITEKKANKKESVQFDTLEPNVNETEPKAKDKAPQLKRVEPKVKSVEPQTSVVTAYCGTDPYWLDRYGKQAQFSDIQVGDRIVAWVKTADNLAIQVLIIKGPAIQKVKGTITAISDNSTTITPTSGIGVTLIWDANTRFVLKGLISVQSGQYAAAVYNKTTMMAITVDVQATAPTSSWNSD